jgi:transposase-like protein
MQTGPPPMRAHGRTNSTNGDGFRRVEVITGVGRRRRWSLEDKARIVAESLDPATTASAVARRYGLQVSQLFTWRQQLQRSALTAETIGGARHWAMVASLMATAKLNGVEPQAWLTDVLERMVSGRTKAAVHA